MSVRRITRRDPKTGARREFWMVDVVFEHVDGRVERVRKVSPRAEATFHAARTPRRSRSPSPSPHARGSTRRPGRPFERRPTATP